MEVESIINKMKLSKTDVLRIVLEWYTMGLEPEVFQNGHVDLEEYLESELEIELLNN